MVVVGVAFQLDLNNVTAHSVVVVTNNSSLAARVLNVDSNNVAGLKWEI